MRTCDYKIMDYYNFLDEFDTYNEWNKVQKKEEKDFARLDSARSGRKAAGCWSGPSVGPHRQQKNEKRYRDNE